MGKHDAIYVSKEQLEFWLRNGWSIERIRKELGYKDISNVYARIRQYGLRHLLPSEQWKQTPLEGTALQVIIGSGYGDGSLICGTYRCSHTDKFAGYIVWKAKLLGKFLRKAKRNFHSRGFSPDYFWDLESRAHPDIYHIEEIMYGCALHPKRRTEKVRPKPPVERKKRAKEELLKKIEPLGLLLWWLDDGYQQKRGGGKLATNGFLYEDVLLIKDFWENMCQNTLRLAKRIRRGKEEWMVYFSKRSLKGLARLWWKYYDQVPSCISYKLPPYDAKPFSIALFRK